MSVKECMIQFEIVGTRLKRDYFQKNMYFDIKVTCNNKTKTITKSFSDFKGFCYRLKKSDYSIGHYKFPSKLSYFIKPPSELIKETTNSIINLLKLFSSSSELATEPSYLEFFQIQSFVDSIEALNNTKALSKASLFVEEDKSDDDFGLASVNDSKAKITNFQFLKVIGKGSFGRVYLVLHKEEHKYYAIKVLEKKLIIERNEAKHIMAERAVLMKNVKHPFLVALHYSFQTQDKLYFVLSYVNGGELFFHLQKDGCFIESRARFYAAEIGHALGYLHSLNIIYRDLKPENILLDSEGHIVLTDFGLAKQFTKPNQTTNTFCGTPEYLAPEIIMKKPYDKSVDWWCYGSVIYEMISGLPPFYSRNVAEMYDNIVTERVVFSGKFSIVSKAFIEALLQKEKTERLGYGLGDFNDVKDHSFLKRINWDDLYNKKIKPPFNPNVSNELDLSNIDEEFVSEEISESVQKDRASPFDQHPMKDNPFLGFTYVQDNHLR